MTKFTKTEENYISHEIEIRLHDKKFQLMEDMLKRMEDKLDSSVKHLDNKFMLMFSVILGSIWIPFILSYLHIVK